jgi:hypothetical protein
VLKRAIITKCFVPKIQQGYKKAEFYAEFKSVEKVAKTFTPKNFNTN